uniref:Putative cytosolic sorting protein gga2/tom1 n=1 Tax=Corethrella appendiculata TaxID=1370023 RepID=U5EP22_9DIPT
MTSFFNVGALANPFSTAIGSKIEQATDASLASENWALNMEICDLINESSDARDAMKAIRKRLTQNAGKNYTVIMYTLTVLETCVKNCGKSFHILVANKEFIQELVKLIGPKNDPPSIVQEKVLSLIQIWADAFRAQQDLQGVVQVYQELKAKGIEFPATDLDNLAPIYTPQRSVPDGTSQESSNLPVSPNHGQQAPGSPAVNVSMPPASQLSQDQIAKLQSELDIVSMNMSILGEMLTELKPGFEEPADYKLLTELTATCREMQGRIVELIGKVNHDELTAELLRLNDELNNLFLRHARYEKNRDPKTATTATPSAILGAAIGVPSTDNNKKSKDSLIDLSDEATGGGANLNTKLTGLSIAGTTSSQLSQINSVTAQSGGSKPDIVSDEFDAFAQSRTNFETSKNGTSHNTEHSESLGTSLKKSQNMPTSMNRESDFDEMEKWLGKGDAETGPEESLTSNEFEKFLAERAAVADNLPTITGQIGSEQSATGSTPSKSHKKKDKEEEGLLAL